MTYFGGNAGDAILCLLSLGTEDRAGLSDDRRGSIAMNLSVFKAWLMAKLNVKIERGANLVEYVLILASSPSS